MSDVDSNPAVPPAQRRRRTWTVLAVVLGSLVLGTLIRPHDAASDARRLLDERLSAQSPALPAPESLFPGLLAQQPDDDFNFPVSPVRIIEGKDAYRVEVPTAQANNFQVNATTHRITVSGQSVNGGVRQQVNQSASTTQALRPEAMTRTQEGGNVVWTIPKAQRSDVPAMPDSRQAREFVRPEALLPFELPERPLSPSDDGVI